MASPLDLISQIRRRPLVDDDPNLFSDNTLPDYATVTGGAGFTEPNTWATHRQPLNREAEAPDPGPSGTGAATSAPNQSTSPYSYANMGNYKPMFGWEGSKLNDPSANTIKYQFGRWVQDKGYTPQQFRGRMGDLANEFNTAFGTNVKGGYGEDALDFGQNWGHLTDVIFGNQAGYDDDVWGWIDTPYPGQAGAGDARGGAGSSAGIYAQGGAGGAGGGLGPDSVGNWLSSLIGQEGMTKFGQGIADKYMSMLGGSGPDAAMSRFESARELANKAFRSEMSDVRGDLANRGLISQPGSPSGAEFNAVQRVAEGIAPDFARAARDAYLEGRNQDQNLLESASRFAMGQGNTMLDAIMGGSQHQGMLANLALQSLAQNQQWEMFLAQFGLDQAQLAHEVEMGNAQNVINLLQLFSNLAGQAGGGYV